MPKIYAEVYGCVANKSDYEIALGLLKNENFEIVDKWEKAEIIIIFTCCVKEPTVNRMKYRIETFAKTNKKLIVAGCLPEVDFRLIEKIAPKASVMGPNKVGKVVEIVKKSLNGKRMILLGGKEEKANLPHIRINPLIEIVQISSGCLGNCSYCATKIARGNLFSFRPHLIRKQIIKALKEGCKEIWLTSQDTSAYGLDIGINLADLINSICKIDGNFWIKIGMMNPFNFNFFDIKDLINAYKNSKVFKFLHLCLQSGSNKVLEIMRRNYTNEEFIKYVREFRKELPTLTLETDVIVGHPGESEEDFEQTIKILEKVQPDITNVSKFSAHPKTLAAGMKRIPSQIVKKRSKIVSELVKEISLKRNEKWIGWEGKVLIDEVGKKGLIGRNFAYKPIVLFLGEKFFGKEVLVKVVEAKQTCLIGKAI